MFFLSHRCKYHQVVYLTLILVSFIAVKSYCGRGGGGGWRSGPISRSNQPKSPQHDHHQHPTSETHLDSHPKQPRAAAAVSSPSSPSLLPFMLLGGGHHHPSIHNSKNTTISPSKKEEDGKDRPKRQVSETTDYKKTVTIQENGKEPIEKSYSWSSSGGTQASTFNGDPNSQIVRETIRKITTTTLSEDNVIDNKPIGSDSLNKPIPSGIGPDGVDTSSTSSERIHYNITMIHSREPVGASGKPELGQKFTCPENHYGNVVIGCRKCQCNDNTDLSDMGNCDSLTGKCLKCLYNTEGDHCERCKANYTGDATKQQCRECVCNQLGTDPNGGPCHPITGQCSCLPYVEGLDCGKCKPGYFNFSSGHGCQACQCDQIGSVSQTCNEFDGKCECHSGYGGRQCNECPLGQFGDPRSRCQVCNCNKSGSQNNYCDNKSGKCLCLTGFGGDKCDRCARGYHGRFPNCESCGECFEQWDEIIRGLKNQTQALLDRVKLLLEIGTTGAYAKEFTEIENKLDRIKHILDNQKLDEGAIKDLARQIEELAKMLRALEKTLTDYEKEAERTTNRTIVVQDALRDFDRIADKLTILIDGLRENATQFQEWNVDGAHAIILDSQNRSRLAEKRVKDILPLMKEQEQKRKLTESMLISTASRYNSSSLQNEATLASLARQIFELENSVPGINQLVCASTSTVNTCDQLCGGALCGKCGGLSCSEGATTKASNALDLALQAMDLVNSKYNQSKLNLDALMEAKNMSEEALRQAKLVMTDCDLQKSKFDRIGNELNGIMDGVDKFSLMDGARPAEVRTLGTECLALSISLKPEQILDLARKINETISSLTNIDKILQDTAGDLDTAEQLHQQADRAKEAADNILDTVEQVLNMLRLAAIEQAKAAAAIAQAQADIEGAQGDLTEISSETELLLKIIAELTDAVNKLKNRLNELRKKYAQNELYVSQAKAAAEEAGKLTDLAGQGADELEDKIKLAEEKLRNKAQQNGQLKDRAERLRNDALKLSEDTRAKMDLLRELDDFFDESVKRVKDFQDIIDDLHKQMNEYLRDINDKAQFYRDCQT